MVESAENEGLNKALRLTSENDDDKVTNENNKRPRDESSDCELVIPPKKACIDEETSSDDQSKSIDGSKSCNKGSNTESKLNKEESSTNIIITNENNCDDSKNDSQEQVIDSQEKKINLSKGDEVKSTSCTKDDVKGIGIDEKDLNKDSTNSEEQENTKDDGSKIENTNESKQDSEVESEKFDKKKNDSAIINGVELTVECASDEESCEESIDETNSKPRSKTVIVREKPNDSEVDVGSTEEENSDSYEVVETKSGNSNSAAQSIEKEGENNGPNTTKAKNSPTSKKHLKSVEVKKKRGRPRGRSTKSAQKSEKESDGEGEKKNTVKEKKSEKTVLDSIDLDVKVEDSKSESSDNKSDNESYHKETFKNGKRKLSTRNSDKIENLKKYIRAAGIRVKCYKTLLEGCKTDAAKARRLKEFLEENGIIGRPTIEKCIKLKEKNEALADIRELDKSNIISGTTRTTRTRMLRNSTAGPETPVPPVQKSRRILKTVVDSDSE